MLRSRRLTVVVCCLLLAGLSGERRARGDAIADVEGSSVFSQVDPAGLAGGKVLTAHPPLGFSRDLSVQSLFLVHAPLGRTLEMLKNWDAAKHPELKVYLHHDFPTRAAPADFDFAVPSNGAVRRLATATEQLPGGGELQLSKAEAAMFKGAGGGGAFPPAVSAFWSQVLQKRAAGFIQRGLGGEPPYEQGGSVRVGEEVSRLLGEQPKVRAAFRPIIEKSALGGGAGSLPVAPYWELFDVEGQGAFSLGAASSLQAANSAQLVDLQYYASGGYYAYVTLYQMWPITLAGKPATLVWRVDSIASATLSDLDSFQRMGSGVAMMKDIERIIHFFQKDSGQ